MKLWQAFLIVMTASILPFALVGVGQAQQMTCWGLKPSQSRETKPRNYSVQHSLGKSEAFERTEKSSDRHEEAGGDWKNSSVDTG